MTNVYSDTCFLCELFSLVQDCRTITKQNSTNASNLCKEFEDIQRGNQNPYIEEEQTTQCPKEKGQKDKQRSTIHTHKTKDRVTRTPLNPEVNSGAPEG